MAAHELAVAVVGPTGLVGEGILDLLTARAFPAHTVRFLGSMRTAGAELEHAGRREKVGLVGPATLEGLDLVFFAAGPHVAGEHAPAAVAAGAAVIDLSSRFRLYAAVPLVVPEVNPATLADFRERGIVASPSSNAIALALVLQPLAAAAGLRRVVVSTYQSAAGAGRGMLRRLSDETLRLLGNHEVREAGRLAFNCVPQIGALEPGGPTTYELLTAAELRKVLHDPGLAVSVTAVRIPVFFGHSMSVVLEPETPLGAEAAADILRRAAGVEVHDATPGPAEIVGSEQTHVARLRNDPGVEHGLMLWITFDNVLRGGALNAVEIAELLAREHL